jgi:MFS family permease
MNENTMGLGKRNLPRDVFLHLFNMVSLYWFAISFITLVWQYINYFFPDILNDSYGFNYSMRFALASLFVVFPLFIFTSWMLNKIYRQESEVRESKIRKWLVYLTLFITALVVVGDLVFILNTFFNGEITMRFALKAFSIIVVALIIFAYYLDDIRKDAPSSMARYYAIAVSAVTILTVVGAFFIVGSPFTARLAGFDQQRVYDLQGIQGQVVNYWQRKEKLPATLTDLTDSISGYVAPVDPQTNQSYEYQIKDASGLIFELCATFKTKGNQNQQGVKSLPAYPDSSYSQNWNHNIGRVCFERKIDTTLYPPINK